MNQADFDETVEALKICSSYAPDKCDHCPIAWLWDHGYDCQPKLAEAVLELLKEKAVIT